MSKAKDYVREVPPIHATFVTRRNAPSDGFLFFWGPEDGPDTDWSLMLRRTGVSGIPESRLPPAEARLILPARDGRYRIENVQGRALEMADAVRILGTATLLPDPAEGRRRRRQPCDSIIAWSYAAKFALELISRACFVPSLKTNGHNLYGVWQAAIESSVDISRVRQLASLMPVCAHALYSVPHNRWDKNRGNDRRRRKPTMMWHPEALVRAFLDAAIDAFIRTASLDEMTAEQIAAVRRQLIMLPRPQASAPLMEILMRDYPQYFENICAHLTGAQTPAAQGDQCPPAGPEICADEDIADEEDLLEPCGADEISPSDDEDAAMSDDSVPPRQFGTSPAHKDAGHTPDDIRMWMPMKEYVFTTPCALEDLPRWESRWIESLLRHKAQSRIDYHLEDPMLVESVTEWLTPLHDGAATQEVDARTGFWLESPTPDSHDLWFLRYVLVANEDPTLAIPASLVFSIGTEKLRIDQHSFENPQERLLSDLGKAARFFEPLQKSLEQSKPEGVFLDVKQAWTFISEVSPMLYSAGFDVRLPEQLTDQGARRLRARFRIRDVAPGDASQGHFGLSELAGFQWEAALGDQVVSAEEFRAIVALKQPLVQWHGEWVLVDPVQLRDIESLMDQNETQGVMTRFDAMSRALTGIADPNSPNSNIEVVVEGKIADILSRLTQEDITDMTMKAPASFVGTLRPYQERGVAWLAYQSRLGLGCCLADDMGLGKTIQLICHILNQIERHPTDRRGFLLICPMSVVGNWKREFARFAPSVHVVVHHGNDRAQSIEELQKKLEIPGTVVLTTYGLITRNSDFLFEHHWTAIVLDEAQAIKNASTKRSMLVRELKADFRVALTGTPIENRLAELWSILDFLNPGLLGTHARFQRIYGIPIERNNDEAAMERLRNLVSPFILRRVKSDPNIIQDLPDKMEYKVYCNLTREQATLYQALVDSTMQKIESASGITRQGQVLALLTHLKQIIDHPALFQKDTPLTQERSGKVQRLVEMLETIVENGERALIFTQYKEMGDVLVQLLQEELGIERVPFLHGGLSASQRDDLVANFQSKHGAPVFILSLKAGGTGLNLTAATHVFHFDRWWNPAVEDQATDRAYRIGQNKNVQVYKFLTDGTLEEKIDAMLEEKKSLSDSIVDASGAWVTQLDADALRELFTLSSDAMIDETN